MSEPVDKAVGRAIASYRATKQWTQTQLADAIKAEGLSLAQQTVAKIELGTRPLKLSEAAVFSAVLGVGVDDLLHVNPGRVSRLTLDYWSDELDAALPNLYAAVERYARARVSAATVVVRAEDTDLERASVTEQLRRKATAAYDFELVDVEAQLIEEIEDKYERRTVEEMFGVLR
ncbi:MAG: helix-turn-helix domain-containing protein [Gordonia polyisoprenivorans]|nr:helix-turn-helix domain-containing protein [Gordonia polyisoprenivorans]